MTKEAQIQDALATIEREERVRVLLAVESGSRAWGFASPDSDWDVRFVYVRRIPDYVSVSTHRDVIEKNLPGDLDLAGWDLVKTLRLFSKCNPALMEWLRSPIVYKQEEGFVQRIRRLESQYISVPAGLCHYRSMALTNWGTYLQDEEIVNLKKYFYVLRPLMAATYLERTAEWPPVPFNNLLQSEINDQPLLTAINQLLAHKATVSELGKAARVPVIDAYIQDKLDHLKTLDLQAKPAQDVKPLNDLLLSEAAKTL